MNREDIIRMAREAGFADGVVDIVGLKVLPTSPPLLPLPSVRRVRSCVNGKPDLNL
jgi:hypothetical protein